MRPGFKFLWVHNVDVDAWCLKHDLAPFVGVCMGCGRSIRIETPFAAAGDVRGLGRDACPHCGSEETPFTYVGGALKGLE